MKFAFALLFIAAALRFVEAGPVADESLTKRAPAPVTKLVCDGDAYKCTAYLDYGDGKWVAQWGTSVFHQGLFGYLSDTPMTTMAPVPVTALNCDGNTYKCTGKLDWGDGHWVAQWNVAVFEQALFSGQEEVVDSDAMAPVPVSKLNCDGNSYKCTANLVWGSGKWVAQWDTAVFHSRF